MDIDNVNIDIQKQMRYLPTFFHSFDNISFTFVNKMSHSLRLLVNCINNLFDVDKKMLLSILVALILLCICTSKDLLECLNHHKIIKNLLMIYDVKSYTCQFQVTLVCKSELNN